MRFATALATRAAVGLASTLKQVNPVANPPGTEAGWSRPWAGLGLQSYRRQKPWALKDYMQAYGGTQDGIVWVYACANLRATELASWQWHIETEDDTELDPEQLPEDLHLLLRRPGIQPLRTWHDFVEMTTLDLDLCGTSYWLKDQMNGYGQAMELMRLRPEYMKVVVDRQGRRIGYLYELPAMGVAVPYTEDEIMRVAYTNPMDDNYGMGKVEAMQRLLGLDITITDHLTGFFQNGARISGVLSTSVPLNDVQFGRMKQAFIEEYGAGASNEFKVLIAEQGVDYTPIVQPPAGSGVVDLVPMTKDQILSGFGVPAPLLGGLMENANYKMEESQHILTRRMLPTATKLAEAYTWQVLVRWDPNWTLELESSTTEPLSTRIERAKNMVGYGASLNEVRREMGLPPLNDKTADVPLLAATVLPWDQVGQATRTTGLVGSGATLNELRGKVGLTPIKEDWADVPLVPSAVTRMDKLGETAPSPFGLPGAPGQPALPASSDEPGTTPEGGVPATPEPGEAPPEEMEPPGPGKGRKAVTDEVLKIPDFGPGWEQLAGAKLVPDASTALANKLLAAKAEVLRQAMPQVANTMRSLFKAQRQRVIERLQLHGSTTREVQRHGRLPKKAIDPTNLWDPGHEDDQLQQAYKPLVDAVATEAIASVGKALHIEVSWDLTSPYVNAARDQLGALITRINDTTRDDIANVVEEGMRRGYSVQQIANGFRQEDYPGIQGVFDEAGAARAEVIARSETAMIYNAAANAGYRMAGVGLVAVLDGEGDPECADANGSTWTIDDAEANPIAHPNCVRSFVPLVQGLDLATDEGVPSGEGEFGAHLPDDELAYLAYRLTQRLAGPGATTLDDVKAAAERYARRQLPPGRRP